MLQCGPQGKGKAAKGAFAGAPKADDEEPIERVIFKRMDELGVEGCGGYR